MCVKVSVIRVLIAHAVRVNAQVTVQADDGKRTDVEFKRERVIWKRILVESQVVVVTRTEVENVAGEHETSKAEVGCNHAAVTGVTCVFNTAVVFFLLKFNEFLVEGFRVVGGMAFHINAGVEHEFHGIAVAAQIKSSVEARPDCVAKGFASAIIHAADKACRNRLLIVFITE